MASPSPPEVTAVAQEVAPPAAAGASITPANSAWTNSAWSQIIASTAAATTVYALVFHDAVTDVDFELDLGKGGAGSETVIATVAGHDVNALYYSTIRVLEFRIPLDNVPTSTRLAVRLRKEGTSTTAWRVRLLHSATVSSTVGVTTAAPLVVPSAASGVSVTPSGTAWVSSSWVQLSSSLANIALLAVGILRGQTTQHEFEIDIGKGGAGSEVVVGTIAGGSGSNNTSRIVVPFGVPLVVSGTNRIAVRIRLSSTNTNVCELKLLYCSASDFSATEAAKYATSAQAATADAAAFPTVAGANSSFANSAWLELIASTATAIVLSGFSRDSASVDVEYEMEIGTGAAGSEVAKTLIAESQNSSGSAGGMQYLPMMVPYDNIGSGVRVAIRFRKTGTSTASWGFGITHFPKPL